MSAVPVVMRPPAGSHDPGGRQVPSPSVDRRRMDPSSEPHAGEPAPASSSNLSRSPGPRSRRTGPDASPTGDAGPRLPVWLRVLLPTILFLPAASAGLVLILIPGYEGLLARDDEVAVLAYDPFAAAEIRSYVMVPVAMRGG